MRMLVKLVEILINYRDGITGQQIADKLNISARTVRNMISNLETHHIQVTSSSKYGYRISEETRSAAKRFVNEPIIEEKTKRQYLLLNRLIKEERVNFYQMTDELFISEGTLDKEIQQLRDFFEEEQLKVSIVRSDNHLKLVAEEEEKRTAIVYFIHYSHEYRNIVDAYQKHFKNEKLEFIHDCLHGIVEKYRLYFTDSNYISFVLFLMIQAERIKNGNVLDNIELKSVQSYVEELEQSLEISSLLSKEFKITYSFSELVYICRLIMTFRTKLYSIDSVKERDAYHNNIYHKFTKKLIQKMEKMFDLNFKEDHDLFLGLRYAFEDIHIRNRIRQHNIHHSQDALQLKYPFVIDLACYVASEYEKEFKEKVSLQGIIEISFLFGAALERQDYWRVIPKMKVAIFCSSGYANSQLIEAKIRRMYQNQIKEVQYFNASNFKKMEKYAPELLLTTEYLIVPYKTKTYRITNYFTFGDQKRIEVFFDAERKKRLKNIINSFFLDKNDTCIILDADSYQDAIIQMLHLVEIKNKEGFFEKVMDRDKQFSTVLDNGIAIPRSGAPIDAIQTKLLVGLLKKKITYNKREIRYIFLPILGENTEKNNQMELLFLAVFSRLNTQMKLKNVFSFFENDNFSEKLMELLD